MMLTKMEKIFNYDLNVKKDSKLKQVFCNICCFISDDSQRGKFL